MTFLIILLGLWTYPVISLILLRLFLLKNHIIMLVKQLGEMIKHRHGFAKQYLLIEAK
jgi:hypothetical protein